MRNIMIIDDDEEDCDLLTDAIKTVDSTIDCVKVFSGKKALDLLATDYKPDFIFLDINMPVLDGKKCLAGIEKNESKMIFRLLFIPHQNERSMLKKHTTWERFIL